MSTEHQSSLSSSLSSFSRMQNLLQKKTKLRQLELAFLAQKHNRSTVPASLSQQLSETEHQLWNHAELLLDEQAQSEDEKLVLELVRQRQHFPMAETWGAFGERVASVQRLLKTVFELLRSEQLQVLGAVRDNIEEAILAVNRSDTDATESPPQPSEEIEQSPNSERWVVGVSIEMGHGLFGEDCAGVDGENLMPKLKSVRSRVYGDSGVSIGLIHLRSNPELDPFEYRIIMQGFEVGRWTLQIDKFLVVGAFPTELQSQLVSEPAYGLGALWIDRNDIEAHQSMGRFVGDSLTVISTHLESLLRNYLGDMLRIGHLDDLLSPVWEERPELLEAIQQKSHRASTVLTVFRELLKEGVSLHDPVAILSVLAESDETDVDPLLSTVRVACHKRICQPYANTDGVIKAVRLSERLQAGLLSTLMSKSGLLQLTLSHEADAQLRDCLFGALNRSVEHGEVVILSTPTLRNALARWVQSYSRWQAVLSEAELTDGLTFTVVQDNIDIADPSLIETLASDFSTAVEHSIEASAKVLKGWIEDEND